MPFWGGIAIIFFSGAGFIRATIRNWRGERWSNLLRGRRWKHSIIILVCLMVYALLLEPLGFFFCTFLFMGFLLEFFAWKG
jgi:hypothetical protein